MASRTASEIWSAILSGCPSVTDSDVKRLRSATGALEARKEWDGAARGRAARTGGGAAPRGAPPQSVSIERTLELGQPAPQEGGVAEGGEQPPAQLRLG